MPSGLKNLNKPVKRIKSFIRQYIWIAKDGLKGKKILVIIITALSMSSAGISGLALAIVGRTVNKLGTNNVIHIPYTNISLNSYEYVLINSVSLTLMLTFAAYAGYYSRLKIRSIARDYFVRSVKRLIDLINQRTIVIDRHNIYDASIVYKMLIRNSIHISQSLERLVMMMQPLCYVIVAVITASYLSPKLSIVTYSLFPILLIPVYRKSAEMNENSRAFFQHATVNMNQTLRSYINNMEASSLSKTYSKNIGNEYISEPYLIEYLNRMDGIKLAPFRLTLITTVFMAFILGFGLSSVGYILLIEGKAWGTALAFMGAIILLLRNLQQLGTGLAFLHSFYPQAVDYLDYYSNMKKIPLVSSVQLPDSIDIKPVKQKYEGSADSLNIKKGEIANILCDKNLTRSNIGYIGTAIIESCNVKGPVVIDYVNTNYMPENEVTIKKYILGDSNDEESVFTNLLDKMSLREEFEKLPDGINTILTEELWNGLNTKLSHLLTICRLSSCRNQLNILASNLLYDFDHNQLHHIMSLFKMSYVFVLSNSSKNILESIDKGFIIYKKHVTGAGSSLWLKNTELDFVSTVAGTTSVEDDQLLYEM